MNKLKNPYVLFGGVFLFGLLVLGTTMIYERTIAPLPILGPTTEDQDGNTQYHQVQEFKLIDQFGDTVQNQHFNDKIHVADFFFTHCPSICPQMTEHLKKVQKEFSAHEIELVSYTVDPERDDPKRLKEYAQTFNINDENWTFLTGDKKQIYLLARNSYFISASEGSGGPDDFIHSDLFTLVDKKGRIRGYYRGTQEEDVRQLIRDIQKLKTES